MSGARRVRALVIAGLLTAVVVGVLASLYASGDPDGLNKVAAEKGMTAEERTHDLEDSPLAGYEASGVDGVMSGGLAAVVGIGVTFCAAGGLLLALRRRSGDGNDSSDAATGTAGSQP